MLDLLAAREAYYSGEIDNIGLIDSILSADNVLTKTKVSVLGLVAAD